MVLPVVFDLPAPIGDEYKKEKCGGRIPGLHRPASVDGFFVDGPPVDGGNRFKIHGFKIGEPLLRVKLTSQKSKLQYAAKNLRRLK